MRIEDVLKKAINKLKENNIEKPILMSKLILANCLKKSKEYILIHEQEPIEKIIVQEYLEKIDKLIQGIPLQYITNKQEFMGLEFYVDNRVLIPQPDTEILVEKVINISKQFKNPKILDVCTGSGAIAISLAKYITKPEIYATDISKDAILVAEKNAIKQNVKINFIVSDMFENIENNEYSIIVSNPPYIQTRNHTKIK